MVPGRLHSSWGGCPLSGAWHRTHPVHGMVRGGCPGETDGRRHPAPVSPPCDLVGACWQCRRPLPRLPSRPDPHSGRVGPPHVPLYGTLLLLAATLLIFCMSLPSMRAFDCLQLIIFTNHCSSDLEAGGSGAKDRRWSSLSLMREVFATLLMQLLHSQSGLR